MHPSCASRDDAVAPRDGAVEIPVGDGSRRAAAARRRDPPRRAADGTGLMSSTHASWHTPTRCPACRRARADSALRRDVVRVRQSSRDDAGRGCAIPAASRAAGIRSGAPRYQRGPYQATASGSLLPLKVKASVQCGPPRAAYSHSVSDGSGTQRRIVAGHGGEDRARVDAIEKAARAR